MGDRIFWFLHKRHFSLLWFAHVVAETGNWLTFIAITVLTYQITGSSLAVSGVFIARAIPSFLLLPVAGIITDRWNRKAILVISEIVRGVAILGLVLASEVSYIYVVYFFIGIAAMSDMFFQVARSAIIPNIVEEKKLAQANAMFAFTSDALSIIGPSLAGLIIAHLGIRSAFILNALSSWTSASMIAIMSITTIQTHCAPLKIRQEWNEAFSFLKGHRAVLLLVLVSALVMLGGGMLNVLLVAFANENLGVGNKGFSWLISALGVGSMLGSLLVGLTSSRIPNRLGLSGSLLALSLVPIVWALSYSFPLALMIAIVNGIANSIFNIVVETALQTHVCDHLRGKILSLTTQLVTITSIIPMSLAGWLADSIGIRSALMIAGLCILPALALSFTKLQEPESIGG